MKNVIVNIYAYVVALCDDVISASFREKVKLHLLVGLSFAEPRTDILIEPRQQLVAEGIFPAPICYQYGRVRVRVPCQVRN